MDQKEYPSMKLLESVFAETAAEIDTSCTQNQKFVQYKRAAFYERSVSGCSPNSSNSRKSRSSSLYSAADAKMGFEELSSIENGRKYQIQRLSGGEYLRTGEASITDELTHSKCLSITYIDNLCEDIGISETQKLIDVGSWSELFLDKCPVGDCTEETGNFDLDHNTENKLIQKGGGKDAIDKSAGNFSLKLFHSDFLSHCVDSEHRPEHSEIWNPFTLFNNNTSSLPNKILSPGWTAKHEREEKDVFSSYSWGEYEVDSYMCRTAIKNNFQNSHITQKGNEPGACTSGSPKNETYFWAPLNDSSNEECKECLNAKTNSLSAMESKKGKSPCDTASFLRPGDRKFFSSRVLGGRVCYTETSDSSEENWNPETFEIKESECKDFRWAEKPEGSTGTINNVEGLSEEATKRRIFFNPKSDVKKDLSRDGMLHFQPLQEVTDQSYEFETGHVPEMDKSFEGNKHTGKDGAKSTYDSDDCNRDQNKTELISQRKESALQMNNFCGNLSPGPSENSSCEMGSESLNLSYKSTNLCDNSDCILLDLTSQFSDESMAHMFSTVPKCLKGDVKENIVVSSIVGTKRDAEELVSARVGADVYHKLFWNDISYSDDSVLAKYYFCLNYLNESKRRQYEDGNHSFSCEQCSKKMNISILCPCKSNSLYEQQAEECMNKDFGTSGINCHKDKRTEALKSQSHPAQKESKALFTTISPKPLFNRALSNNRQLGNPPVSKDKEVFEARKTETNVLGPKRHWERASIAWSAYRHGELKPRSQYVQTPVPGKEAIRKSICSTSCRKMNVKVYNQNLKKRSDDQNRRKPFLKNANAWTESRQHHDSAVQDCDEINLRRQGDHDLLPWLLLPDELWFCIFSLLTHKDISRVSQVCRRFYQLARDGSFWKKIQLINCHCLNDDWLITLGKRHPQCFTLDHCHDEAQKVTGIGLKQFFQQCEGSLKELNIRSCSGPGFRGDTILLHASTFCHNLRAVDISWTGATDSGLIALVKASRSLQCLSANGCKLTDDSVAMLTEDHGKRLMKLEIFGCHAVTAKCLRSVAVKCPDLKVLNIGRVPKTTEDCLAKIVNSMEKLTSLNCTGLNMVKDYLVCFIVKKCPELECLILSSCSQVTDISLMEISTHLPSVRYLDFSGCEKVTDTGVQALATRCHKLSYLDLSSTSTSNRGSTLLALKHHHYTVSRTLTTSSDGSLSVHCRQICLLASFCFRTLECVKLNFCKDLSMAAIGKLCRNCKKLKILHLYGCRFIPDLESIKNINKTVEVFYDLQVPAAKLSSE